MRRRLLIVLLFGLILAGGATVTWQAMGKAKLVEEDLTTARALLARAGGFESGELKRRLRLVKQAEQHTLSAQQRLDRWPLRQLGALLLVGRDIRVARAVAVSGTGTVRATRRVVTALQPIETGPQTEASILRASEALLGLHTRLERDLDQVRAARPLLIAGTRTRYMKAASSASVAAERAGEGLKLAAGLYGPSGTTRWFLAFQNPAELRGTGGLIGEYGILESSPTGPKLVKVDHYDGLNERTSEGVALPGQLAARYERFAIGRDWTAVNIPPDMPTVGAIISELYERTTGDRIDGVIAADPLAVAEILRVAGPIQASGAWLDADSVAEETLVRAYVRFIAFIAHGHLAITDDDHRRALRSTRNRPRTALRRTPPPIEAVKRAKQPQVKRAAVVLAEPVRAGGQAASWNRSRARSASQATRSVPRIGGNAWSEQGNQPQNAPGPRRSLDSSGSRYRTRNRTSPFGCQTLFQGSARPL